MHMCWGRGLCAQESLKESGFAHCLFSKPILRTDQLTTSLSLPQKAGPGVNKQTAHQTEHMLLQRPPLGRTESWGWGAPGP